jgi:dephospho-CoA kinase
MRIIGLTGGIGSGKSTVSALLRELGAYIVDADEAARAVVEPGRPGLEEVVAEFGPEMLGPDGRLDRARLARRVFADDAARMRLNAIVHPHVRQWMAAETARGADSGAPLLVTDVPLLYESGLDAGLDGVIVVWTPESTQVERAVARGMEEADVRARIRAQMPLEEKRRRATHVIDNSGSAEETKAAVQRLWSELVPD